MSIHYIPTYPRRNEQIVKVRELHKMAAAYALDAWSRVNGLEGVIDDRDLHCLRESIKTALVYITYAHPRARKGAERSVRRKAPAANDSTFRRKGGSK